ncbi:MAG: DUF4282 domain-containing protein, partial [Gemmata sp.]|nr:DUF4282 domain-containing protein [Gemmata sp.]
RKRKAYGKQLLLDYLFFRRMISPILIQIFFWVGAVGSVSVGLYFFVDGFIPQERGLARIINRSFDDDRDIRRFDNDEPLKITKQPIRAEKTINLLESFGGFLLIIFGPFFTRILCENMIVLFQINETLTDIRNQGL